MDPSSYSDTAQLELACETLVALATRTEAGAGLRARVPGWATGLAGRARALRT